jgi:N-acetylglucosaminyl-diphospho-decaprenol L-rhamnosyltransferase
VTPLAPPPGVDIVVVTYNARADVVDCLTSVHAHPPARPWRLFVVDNASHDGTPDDVAARWPAVQLTRLPSNVGFAAANNVGIAAGAHPLVLLLNSDTVAPPGQLEALCQVMDAHQAVGAAGPRLEDAHQQPELSFGPMMSLWGETRQKLTGWALASGPAWWRARAAARLERPRYVDWVSGACLIARRDVLAQVGGLDTRYFMYAEDVDLCAAIRRAGHLVRFSPEARIVHRRGRSRATAPTATSAHYRRSQLAFYEKHHPRWAWLLRAYLRARGVEEGPRLGEAGPT